MFPSTQKALKGDFAMQKNVGDIRSWVGRKHMPLCEIEFVFLFHRLLVRVTAWDMRGQSVGLKPRLRHIHVTSACKLRFSSHVAPCILHQGCSTYSRSDIIESVIIAASQPPRPGQASHQYCSAIKLTRCRRCTTIRVNWPIAVPIIALAFFCLDFEIKSSCWPCRQVPYNVSDMRPGLMRSLALGHMPWCLTHARTRKKALHHERYSSTEDKASTMGLCPQRVLLD